MTRPAQQLEYIITEDDCLIMDRWEKIPKYWVKYLRSRPHTSTPEIFIIKSRKFQCTHDDCPGDDCCPDGDKCNPPKSLKTELMKLRKELTEDNTKIRNAMLDEVIEILDSGFSIRTKIQSLRITPQEMKK